MRSRLLAGVAVALAVSLTACERADERSGDTGATTLTVYASLPFQGPSGPDSEQAANGARLALREAGGKAGELVIKLVVLDSSTTRSERWDPAQTADNARVAVRDRTAIAYLGDGPSGATAISLPILNAAGIVQVSPTSSYQGLTGSRDAGKGEPERFYPSGRRSFARPIPGDDVQGRAMTDLMLDQGCRRVQLLADRDVGGQGLAAATTRSATAAGMEIAAREDLRADVDVQKLARSVASNGVDCALFAGALAEWVPGLFDALQAADPRLQLFGGGDGLASDAFAAAMAPATQAQVHLTAPAGVSEPLPGVRAFVRRYERAFDGPARNAALHGYDAMRLVLAAVERAGAQGGDRTAVTEALFALGERRSPLGPYAIGRDGASTRTEYAQLAVRDGRVVRRRTASFGPG